jgi:calcineurin-like phosphoesterase family protein
MWNSAISKRDTVYVLGDSIFDEKGVEDIKQLSGRKVLVLGNHCTEYVKVSKLLECFDDIHSLLKKSLVKGESRMWLSHCPIHPDELRGAVNVHGHTHSYTIKDPRYLCVSLEQTDYKPVDIEYLREYFRGVK